MKAMQISEGWETYKKEVLGTCDPIIEQHHRIAYFYGALRGNQIMSEVASLREPGRDTAIEELKAELLWLKDHKGIIAR